MRSNWVLKNLGDICGFVRGPFGGSLKKSIFLPDGFAVYEQQHAIYDQFSDIRYFVSEKKFNEMKRFELRPNDLIMSCSGTMGKVAKVPPGIKRGIINQALLKLTPSKFLDSDFLLFWMKSPNFQEQLAAETTGVAIKNVASVKVLKEIKIELPNIPEQKRIVEILNEAFAGIDQAIANTEKNIDLIQELFENYLNIIFTQRGPGWKETTLGSVCKFENGDRGKNYPSRANFVSEGIPFINAGHIADGEIDFEEMNYISQKTYALLSRGKILKEDVLFCLRGSLGKFAVVKNQTPGAIASSLVILRPKEELTVNYLLHYLRSGHCKEMISKYAGGAAQPNLGAKDLAKFSISLPAVSEQSLISERINTVMDQVKDLKSIYESKLKALKELKKSYLQKAFSGELTANEAKDMAEAAE